VAMALKLSHTQRYVGKKVWAVPRCFRPISIETIGQEVSSPWTNAPGMSPQVLRFLREEGHAALELVAGPDASHTGKCLQDLTDWSS